MFKVAIVGRPNVGKSTLFNRFLGRKRAFVDKVAGITRDRNYGEVGWGKFSFTLIDTGGISDEKTSIVEKIKEQIDFAIKEADLIILLLDGREGILSSDIEILNSLRKSEKDIILVVNKIDKIPYKEEDLANFYKLSPSPIPISSTHGINVNELLDEIRRRSQESGVGSLESGVWSRESGVRSLESGVWSRGSWFGVRESGVGVRDCKKLTFPKSEIENPKSEIRNPKSIHIAILGRPNVGKSSMLNQITQKQRAIVDSTPGTTRDPVIEGFVFKEREFTLLDTAGIRKKIASRIEAGYVASAKRSIRIADIVWLIIDSSEGITAQEKKIIEEIETSYVPYIIVVNKIDLADIEVQGSRFKIQDSEKVDIKRDYKNYIKINLPFLDGLNILFTSALTGRGIKTLLNETYALANCLNMSIKTNLLNKVISKFPKDSLRFPRIYYATQTGFNPPTFTLFVNNPLLSTDDWIKKTRRALRKKLNIPVPIKVLLKKA